MSRSLPVRDRLDLADLVARYAVAVDARRFGDLREVFTEEGELDTGRAVRRGIEAVIEAMQALRRYEATSHVLGQQLFEGSGEGAVGLVYCTAHHLGDDDAGRTDKVMHLRYHDRYVRLDEGWRIASRRLELVWTDTSTVR